jgi:cytochrome c-type biogenesis protein CcmE
MIVIFGAGALLALAVGLTLTALQEKVTFFVKPSEVAAKAEPGQRVRIGGLVELGSVRPRPEGGVLFRVIDSAGAAGALEVLYPKSPPDLFREQQGVVAEGKLGPDGVFQADMILAKHDENYMPKEVAEALKESGEWRGPVKPDGQAPGS